MPNADPISLTVAVIVAVIGGLLGLFITGRLVMDVRRRRRLLAEQPDTSALDADIQRYLRRCWLLYAAWRNEVSDAGPIDAHWARLMERAESLQAERAADEDTSISVSELVELERELETLIDELR